MDEQETTTHPAPESAQTQAAAPEHKTEYNHEDIEKNKAVACLSYIFILFLVPLLTLKESKFAQFHAKQGLALFLAWIIVDFVLGIIPFLGWMLLPFANLLFIIVSIIAIIKTLSGEIWELPVIAGLAKKINL